ncbi:hypothetical protein HK100_001376 [Physocladia obscura]|uniref:BZIP domain-containing protein n=1 Tax=Physocladia obscura TaxID=109957 RepID=A0AAD5SYW7_9FUNG|nr:hypothetical protein HK100_001376 [Physocladia obscura]
MESGVREMQTVKKTSKRKSKTGGRVPTTIYTPRSGRGRQMVTTKPLTERHAYMREQQRTFRQRKQKYLEDLELLCEQQQAEILILQSRLHLSAPLLLPAAPVVHPMTTAMPTSITVTTTHPCAKPECKSRAANLEMLIRNLKGSQQQPTAEQLLPAESLLALAGTEDAQQNDCDGDSVSTPTATAGDSVNLPSAEELYGLPVVQDIYDRLTRIPASHSGAKCIGRMKTIFFRLIRVIDKKTARSLILRMFREHNRLFEMCGVLERAQILELLAGFFMATKKHNEHVNQFLSARSVEECPPTFKEIPESKWPARIRQIKAEIKKVPSLIQVGDDLTDPHINLLCNFWARPENHELTSEEFFQLHSAGFSIISLIKNVEDMRQLLMTAEILRELSKRELDELLAGIESATI